MKFTRTEGTEEGKHEEEFQKQIEVATTAINSTTGSRRQNAEKKIPDVVTDRTKVAARSERPIGRMVLRKKQARQARARHGVKCSLMQGKINAKENVADRTVRGRIIHGR